MSYMLAEYSVFDYFGERKPVLQLSNKSFTAASMQIMSVVSVGTCLRYPRLSVAGI